MLLRLEIVSVFSQLFFISHKEPKLNQIIFDFIFHLNLVRGVNTAEGLVDYCSQQPMFRGVNQRRHALSITTRRIYHHLTRNQVEQVTPESLVKDRAVLTFAGDYIHIF